jgi:hypothetical protein
MTKLEQIKEMAYKAVDQRRIDHADILALVRLAEAVREWSCGLPMYGRSDALLGAADKSGLFAIVETEDERRLREAREWLESVVLATGVEPKTSLHAVTLCAELDRLREKVEG